MNYIIMVVLLIALFSLLLYHILLLWRVRDIRNCSFQETCINKTIDEFQYILMMINYPHMFQYLTTTSRHNAKS